MTQPEFRTNHQTTGPETAPPTYYDVLNVSPAASAQKIRQSYRELSKLYHPDTTELPAEVATAKFQILNEAYATLSSPDRRLAYDLSIGYSRYTVVQPRLDLDRPKSESKSYRSSAYLDPTDRPLSAGEISVLFALAVTFIGCLLLALWIGISRGELVWPAPVSASQPEKIALARGDRSIYAPRVDSCSFTIEEN